jgi:hypothetical protein
MGILTLAAEGPASGTYTATPTANRLAVYMWAGGAGGAVTNNPAISGAPGGYGFYNKPITQPFSQPYSVGAAGVTAPSQNGGPGGNTTFTNVGTVNGGTGGPNNGNQGAVGTAPGATLVGIRGQIAYLGRAGSYSSMCGSFSVTNHQGYGAGGTYFNSGNSGALVVFENTGT